MRWRVPDQTERERRIAEKREARAHDRAMRRRQEYVRRCRAIIEERRQKVRKYTACARVHMALWCSRQVPWRWPVSVCMHVSTL